MYGEGISKRQGRENAKNFLKENAGVAWEIEDKIRASHGLDFDMPKPEAEAAAADDGDDVLEA